MTFYKHGTLPYMILTFPRSGSNFFQNILVTRFGITSDRYHDGTRIKNPDRFVIAIVRNPIDCIASNIAREHRNGQNSINRYKSDFWNKDFIKTMEEIQALADIIISFDELTSNYESIINKLSNLLGWRAFDNHYDLTVGDMPLQNTYIPSSKVVPEYDDIYQNVAKMDLSPAIEAYERVLSKAI